jgi:hypothetical protein
MLKWNFITFERMLILLCKILSNEINYEENSFVTDPGLSLLNKHYDFVSYSYRSETFYTGWKQILLWNHNIPIHTSGMC